MLLIAMTTMMSNVAIVTALPHLKEHFTTEQNIEFLARMMLTLPSLAIAFLAPVLGHLVFKIGRKKSALFALLLFTIAGSAGLYLHSINELLVSRFFLGIAIATLMIVSTSLVGDYFKGDDRHKFMGIQGAFISIGGVVFVVGGGILSDINWRYSFAIYLIGIILIPLVYKFLNEKVIEEDNNNNNEINDISLNIFYVYFLAFVLMLIFYILPTQIPFLIMNHFGSSGTLTGAIIATAFISNAIGAIAFRKLKQKFTYAQIYIIGMSIIAFGFIAIGLVTNVYFFFLTSPIMGFGGGVLMTNMTAWMLSLTHHTKRIQSSGYLTSALFLGQFFSPIIFHPLVSFVSIDKFFIIVGVLIFMVTLVSIIIRTKRLKQTNNYT
jgi:MFS family permease